MTSHQDRDLMTALHDQLYAALAQWTDRANATGKAAAPRGRHGHRCDRRHAAPAGPVPRPGDARDPPGRRRAALISSR